MGHRAAFGREAPDPAPSAPVAPTIAPPLTKPGARGEAPTLAVLPFVNRSGLAEDDVFAFGMVEDVIDALSQNAAVNVLSSSATAQYRANAVPDLAAMARELEVRYVLEGNVRRSGEALRVTAQLVEPANGRIVWTQKFDRPLSELAAMQEDLVLEVAAQLDANVSRLEVERALRKPTDLTAWQAVTIALTSYTTFKPEDLKRAADLAASAVAIDPSYGLAHAFLAFARSLIYSFLVRDDPIEVALIRTHAERALQLDPANSLVLAFAAQAFGYIDEPHLALAHATHAFQQRPNSVQTCAAMGEILNRLNRTTEAIEYLDKACRATKQGGYFIGVYGWKGIAMMRASRWAEAEAVEDEMLSIHPKLNFALMHKAILCQRDGRASEARVFAQRVREADPDISLEVWELRMSRWHQNSPTLDEVLDNLRAVWAETEGAG